MEKEKKTADDAERERVVAEARERMRQLQSDSSSLPPIITSPRMSEKARLAQERLVDNRADIMRILPMFNEVSFAIHPLTGSMIVANPSYEHTWEVMVMVETGETTWGHPWAFKYFLDLDYEKDCVEGMNFVFGHMRPKKGTEFETSGNKATVIDFDMTRGEITFDDVILAARKLTEDGRDGLPYISPESLYVINPGRHTVRERHRNLGGLAGAKLSDE
jgi:hypothetical protein